MISRAPRSMAPRVDASIALLREVRVDDDRIGHGCRQQLEDPRLEVQAALSQHRHERRAGQRLAGVQDVQLHRLGAWLRQVGPLRGYLAHGDKRPAVMVRR